MFAFILPKTVLVSIEDYGASLILKIKNIG